jgi:hypothetical protein
MLIGVPGDRQLSNLIRDFKRITTRIGGIDWQRNFFDHRLRHAESENEKVAYIRANPVRGGLVGPNDHWLPAYVAAYRLLHSRLRCPLLGMKLMNSAALHLPVFDEVVWDFLQKTRGPLENVAISSAQTHLRIGEIQFIARACDGHIK